MESTFRKSGFQRLGVYGTVHAYSVLGFSWSKNCVCRVVPYSFWDIQAAEYCPLTVRTAGQHGSRRKQKSFCVRYQIKLQRYLLKVSSVQLGDMESVPHRQPLPDHFLWQPRSRQRLQDSCNISWVNCWRIPMDENAPNSTGFLWHPLLASPDIQSWLLLPTYPRLPVCLIQSYFQSASVQGTHNPQISTR